MPSGFKRFEDANFVPSALIMKPEEGFLYKRDSVWGPGAACVSPSASEVCGDLWLVGPQDSRSVDELC